MRTVLGFQVYALILLLASACMTLVTRKAFNAEVKSFQSSRAAFVQAVEQQPETSRAPLGQMERSVYRMRALHRWMVVAAFLATGALLLVVYAGYLIHRGRI